MHVHQEVKYVVMWNMLYLQRVIALRKKHITLGISFMVFVELSRVIQSIDITPASVHDIHMLKDVKMNYSKCTLLGDLGYLSADFQLNLFETVQVKLQTPKRKNQTDYVEQPFVFKRGRKRIETLFSQMCDQLRIRNNYTKSFDGYKIRIPSKITAITVIQHLNKFVFNRPINNLKVNLA